MADNDPKRFQFLGDAPLKGPPVQGTEGLSADQMRMLAEEAALRQYLAEQGLQSQEMSDAWQAERMRNSLGASLDTPGQGVQQELYLKAIADMLRGSPMEHPAAMAPKAKK